MARSLLQCAFWRGCVQSPSRKHRSKRIPLAVLLHCGFLRVERSNPSGKDRSERDFLTAACVIRYNDRQQARAPPIFRVEPIAAPLPHMPCTRQLAADAGYVTCTCLQLAGRSSTVQRQPRTPKTSNFMPTCLVNAVVRWCKARLHGKTTAVCQQGFEAFLMLTRIEVQSSQDCRLHLRLTLRARAG